MIEKACAPEILVKETVVHIVVCGRTFIFANRHLKKKGPTYMVTASNGAIDLELAEKVMEALQG